ncbi:MAG: amidohydrolase family protein [Deltaproteobacteria bacterium]|nr:amidohydrolase family protein [Deltaproteobacteria bacterium]
MIYDIHVHTLPERPLDAASSIAPLARQGRVLRALLRTADRRLGGGSAAAWVAEQVAASRVDRAVVLAIDSFCGADGVADRERTLLHVPNDEVAALCRRHPRLLFGASVHPYRPDALTELDRVAALGACLVKWIPSAQNIAPDDERCLPFYERLVALGLPLLSHTGIEHTLSVLSNDLNHPRRLRLALERGVTVIAAHCGTRLFLYERSQFSAWQRLALEHERCYGDLGAFGLPLHGGPLRTILADRDLCAKAVYGSDFPALVLPTWYAPAIGWQRARLLSAIANPLDRACALMQDLGVPAAVFARAGGLLRLPGRLAAREPGATPC